jgi:glutathione S-transferase
VVTDSLICDEYLEEAYPASAGYPALLPSSPFERAKARQLIEGFSSIVSEFYRCVFLMSVFLKSRSSP